MPTTFDRSTKSFNRAYACQKYACACTVKTAGKPAQPIEKSTAGASLLAHIKDEAVEVDVHGPLPAVRGDYIRLVEVFANLISNAIKYNDKPHKKIEIGVDKSSGDASPVIYVRDNGIGIQEKHYPQIFEIFRRLHGRNDFGGGSGAGLTIIKKIIERHGGRIWLDSTVGQGTTFYFTLTQDPASGEKT